MVTADWTVAFTWAVKTFSKLKQNSVWILWPCIVLYRTTTTNYWANDVMLTPWKSTFSSQRIIVTWHERQKRKLWTFKVICAQSAQRTNFYFEIQPWDMTSAARVSTSKYKNKSVAFCLALICPCPLRSFLLCDVTSAAVFKITWSVFLDTLIQIVFLR